MAHHAALVPDTADVARRRHPKVVLVALLSLATVVRSRHGATLLRQAGLRRLGALNSAAEVLGHHPDASAGRNGPAQVFKVSEQVLDRLIHDHVDAFGFFVDGADELFASGCIGGQALTRRVLFCEV